ncbi:MAG: hypothetical protein ACPG77_06915, partial [Nannocystaceae bacterium]
MYRPFRLLALLTPLAFALPACGGDDGGSASETDPTATTEDTQTPGTTETGTDTDNPTGNETETTEGPTTDDPTTDGPTTEDPTEEPTTEDPTEEPTTEDPTEEPTTDTGIDANCGNGEIEGDEACDDGNNVTEISESMATPMTYADGACIDDCSLVLGHCGDGVVDPGEACDDGNLDPYDDCTPSCTENDGSFSSPCFRDCGGDDCSSTNIQDGEIVGCGNVQAPPNAEKVCLESANDEVLMNEIHLYFAEGKCAVMAQKCDGFVCPGDLTIGDYDSFTDCPPGTEMVDRVTDSGLVTVSTKVCHKVCERDADCRWNAFDDVWVKSG